MNFVRAATSPKPTRADSLQNSARSVAAAAAFRNAGKHSITDRPPIPSRRTSNSNSTPSSNSLSVSSLTTLGIGPSTKDHCLPTKDVPDVAAASIPLEKHYSNLRNRGITGQHWMLFDATSNFGKIDASVLIFEKKRNIKASSKLGRNRLSLLDLLRYDVSQVMTVTHPRILRVFHGVEENKDVVCLATEVVHGTIDQILVDEGMDKLEMKLGVLQIIDGMSYLHNSAKILHGNLTPAAIFVTATRLWKIGGFQFAVAGNSKQANAYPCYPWTKKLPAQLQPDLDFLAPEYLNTTNQVVTTAADVFSLGILICWIYSGGKRLIDAKNNLESYNIIVNQLDAALNLIQDELGANLTECIAKVVSKDVSQRPAVQFLALIKHFDDPTLVVLRQLDDIAQEFDPAHKITFLSQNLYSALPMIPEPLWFNRILQRFNENLTEYVELYPAILRPLMYMLTNCESHNIYKLRAWFRRITANINSNEEVSVILLENLHVIFRKMNDEEVEDRCYALLLGSLSGENNRLKQAALKIIPYAVDYMPLSFVRNKLISLFLSMEKYFQENTNRQVELLIAVAHLSDRCDAPTLQYLLTVSSVCNSLHPSIVHSKSRLVQRILHTDVSRLTDPLIITHHLLNPLILGLALPELTSAHFDDVMSSIRILLDIVEQLRYESDDAGAKRNESGRLYNRRVSMSSSHLPRLLVTAARPSFSGDNRKMSFLSADGRLEDRGRRESNQSKSSFESDMSILIGNGSDLSDESGIVTAQRGRRKSWLEGCAHSMSLEQSNPESTRAMEHRRSAHGHEIRHHQSARARSSRSPIASEFIDCKLQQQPARPNSFTNLGHNLACTLWKTFY
ncbi:hypothetical protein FO519_000460 [Halicephalobus sp. NKZ332]|nr:hypothetical protein FO519_000460 [Halicephalobus sp. NKZ332]